MSDTTNCSECGAPTDEHVGRKNCLPPAPPRKVRGLYDLPIFGWAWKNDARKVEK